MNYSEEVLRKSVFERELIRIETNPESASAEVVEYITQRVAEINRKLKERRS
jgi:hypothetical protein